jgi:hypothetical protein
MSIGREGGEFFQINLEVSTFTLSEEIYEKRGLNFLTWKEMLYLYLIIVIPRKLEVVETTVIPFVFKLLYIWKEEML